MTEYYTPPAFTDRNGIKLVEGDVVIYKDSGYVYKGMAEPLGLACIDAGVEGDKFVKPEDLEVVL